ncbi:MAG: GNAT family N-acetyltransferase [Christensenellales bacterium]|jgi:GNAT superfamily N-acetyltransferase
MRIIRAEEKHTKELLEVTKRAFLDYKNELSPSIEVKALNETEADVLTDIINNEVYVALENKKIIGGIRVKKLSDQLAYIYRFAVDKDSSGQGVGTGLLGHAIEECIENGYNAIALHTNTKYYKLAKYYYGKNFFVHSTTTDKGYIRALFVKELNDHPYDITPATLI